MRPLVSNAPLTSTTKITTYLRTSWPRGRPVAAAQRARGAAGGRADGPAAGTASFIARHPWHRPAGRAASSHAASPATHERPAVAGIVQPHGPLAFPKATQTRPHRRAWPVGRYYAACPANCQARVAPPLR